MRPFDYPKPVMPEVVKRINRTWKTFDQGLANSYGPGIVEGLATATHALLEQMEIARDLTDEERRDIAEYNRQVDLYNFNVKAYNDALRAERDAARAAADLAKIRDARCPKCFCPHGPGQVECW